MVSAHMTPIQNDRNVSCKTDHERPDTTTVTFALHIESDREVTSPILVLAAPCLHIVAMPLDTGAGLYATATSDLDLQST